MTRVIFLALFLGFFSFSTHAEPSKDGAAASPMAPLSATEKKLLSTPPDSVYADQARSYFGMCIDGRVETAGTCEQEQLNFLRDYVDAFANHYTAQENVAYSFERDLGAGIAHNIIQACAWRLVILHSGSPHVTSTDAEHIRYLCSELTSAEQQASEARASAIRATIRRSLAKPIPDADDDGP